jgi:hypothetical protein
MSAVQVSRLLRVELEARFASLYNDAVSAACTEFGIADLSYAINFAEASSLPQNFYRGEWTMESLMLREPEFPCMAMWVGAGRDDRRSKPRSFSGVVAVYWRVWLSIVGIRKGGLVDLREATEAAMIATLDPELPSLGYVGDLEWAPLGEQQLLSQDEQHFGWIQQVTYSATFEVNV